MQNCSDSAFIEHLTSYLLPTGKFPRAAINICARRRYFQSRARKKKRNISNQTCYQLTNRCTVENKSEKERKRNIKESSRESTNSHEGKKKESRREMLNRFSRLGTYRHSLRFSSPFQSPKPYSAHNLWVVVVVVIGYNRLPSRLHTYFPHVERQPPYLCRLAS